MGAPPARIVAARRSRPRAYLLLSRVSNLPTVWSNVLAGWTVARMGPPAGEGGSVAAIAVAVSLLYVGGMFLNDAFDAGFDSAHRPDRPVPAGDVARGEAFSVGFALLAAGVGIAAMTAAATVVWAIALAAAIVLYDVRHKGVRVGPLVMGLCRGLVYCLAAAAAASVSAAVVVAAAILIGYTASLTMVAKQAGPRAGAVVPIMLAGISLLDATVIAWAGGGSLALLAAVCFPLTLALQRVVPGT